MESQNNNSIVTPTPDVGGPPPPSSDSSGNVSALSDIASTLASTMPDVQPHAVAARRADMENNSGQTDIVGTVFDPEIHAVDNDGNPKKTLLGKFASKRKRDKKDGEQPRKTANPGNVAGSRLGTGTPKVDEKAQALQQAHIAGQSAAGATIMLGMTLGGEEWKPLVHPETGLNEFDTMSKAYGDYFAAKGMTDIPPGVALTIALFGYILPRFFMPKTQTRVQKVKLWIAAKWIKWRAKKKGIAVDVEPAH